MRQNGKGLEELRKAQECGWENALPGMEVIGRERG